MASRRQYLDFYRHPVFRVYECMPIFSPANDLDVTIKFGDIRPQKMFYVGEDNARVLVDNLKNVIDEARPY